MAWSAPLWAAGISAVGNLAGASLSDAGSRKVARENRRYQERMSNTAYQRAAKDLSAAGLNRVLALGNPASTPSGNLPQVADLSDLGSKAVGSAQAAADIQTKKSTRDLVTSQIGMQTAQTGVANAQAASLGWDSALKKLQFQKESLTKKPFELANEAALSFEDFLRNDADYIPGFINDRWNAAKDVGAGVLKKLESGIEAGSSSARGLIDDIQSLPDKAKRQVEGYFEEKQKSLREWANERNQEFIETYKSGRKKEQKSKWRYE